MSYDQMPRDIRFVARYLWNHPLRNIVGRIAAYPRTTALNSDQYTRYTNSRVRTTSFGNYPQSHPSVQFGPANNPTARSNSVAQAYGRSAFASATTGVVTGATATVRPQTTSMSRKRGRYRTRRGVSYGNFKKRRSGGGAGVTALREVRKLKRNIEKKMVEWALADTTTAATGNVQNIALVSQGDGLQNRSGNSIAPYLLEFNMMWQGDVKATDDVFRLIIFRDNKQVNSTTPAVTAVLRATNVISMYNYGNKGRFQILFDECYTAPGDAAVRQMWVRKLRLQLKGKMGWTTNTDTSINSRGLYWLAITNQATDVPHMFWTARLHFTDS